MGNCRFQKNAFKGLYFAAGYCMVSLQKRLMQGKPEAGERTDQTSDR